MLTMRRIPDYALPITIEDCHFNVLFLHPPASQIAGVTVVLFPFWLKWQVLLEAA